MNNEDTWKLAKELINYATMTPTLKTTDKHGNKTTLYQNRGKQQ